MTKQTVAIRGKAHGPAPEYRVKRACDLAPGDEVLRPRCTVAKTYPKATPKGMRLVVVTTNGWQGAYFDLSAEVPVR